MSAIDQLLANNQSIRLPTPPAMAMRILEEVNKEEPSFSRLTELITTDPALTTRILRIVNSAFMAPQTRIDNLNKALTRMGIGLITNVALSFVLVDSFKGSLGSEFDFDYFWKRAVTAAIGANIIANKICCNNDTIFIAALLHDIGILIASKCLPNYREIFNRDQHNNFDINSSEQDHFGFSHAELGSEILSSWGLPEKITIPIAFHQQPNLAPENEECSARVINLADKVSAAFHGRSAPKKINKFREVLQQSYNLSNDTIDQLIEQISEQNNVILSFFDIPNGSTKSASEILQEANEALSNLNLSTTQLVAN